MTFTSNKSMEIEVLVDANPVLTNTPKRYRAASAFFTYVSLSQEGRSLPVPQLVVSVPLGPPRRSLGSQEKPSHGSPFRAARPQPGHLPRPWLRCRSSVKGPGRGDEMDPLRAPGRQHALSRVTVPQCS